MSSNHINIQHYIFDITIPLQRPNKTERILITKSQTNMSVYSPYTCGIPELKVSFKIEIIENIYIYH